MSVAELSGAVFRGPDPPPPPASLLSRLARHSRIAGRSRQPTRRHRARHAQRSEPAPTATPRTAFVFAGGGARGAAQIGMLEALVAHGVVPDAVYGASVGAINAAGFAGDPSPAGVARMSEQWRGLTSEDVFSQGRFPAPWRFFQQRPAVHRNDGLRRVIEAGCTIDRLEDARIPLQIVATSLSDGRARWFTEGPLIERVLASSALPALFPSVNIDGEAFIDGGVVDNVPISRAFAQGATRVFVLLCGPLHYRPYVSKRPIEAVLTAFFIAVHARFVRELASLPPGTEVIVITAGSDPVARYDDFSATGPLMTVGKANAEGVLRFWEQGHVGELVQLRETELFDAVTAGRQREDEADHESDTATGAPTDDGADDSTGSSTGSSTGNGAERRLQNATRRPLAASRAVINSVRNVSERQFSRPVGTEPGAGEEPEPGAGEEPEPTADEESESGDELTADAEPATASPHLP